MPLVLHPHSAAQRTRTDILGAGETALPRGLVLQPAFGMTRIKIYSNLCNSSQNVKRSIRKRIMLM
jgi:hypothetical protein